MSDSMTITFPGGLKVAAAYNGFEILTDQDHEDGGDGSAPAPYDLFLASLATCAGIYVLRFCQKRELATAGLEITQRWQRDEKSRRIERIELEVRLPAGFPDKYRDAVIRAAGQCAVKKTLAAPPEIEVLLSDSV